ncbi:MAG TPA: type II toxin-antitoxin system VapC family toxin [Terriglobia bacterium]|nr:type II toxin-antitoxin system VapC family toxin [Terriglobia bacterium]
MAGYADTSFLVSLYLPDANSSRARSLMQSRPSLVLTPLHELEVTSALELAVFRKAVAPRQARDVRRNFEQDLASIFTPSPLPEDTYLMATQMARRRSARLGTRTLDILHVAAAKLLKAECFYSFDGRQVRLAAAEGLKVLPAMK